jgi:hypothetical protein
MARNRARIVLAALILAFVPCGTVSAPATAQDIDRSAPRPPPPQKYKVSDEDLRNIGLAHGEMPAFPHKCYGNVSISNEFLSRFQARGFSLEALCLAIMSPWVQYHPETGKPLPVSKDFLFVVPDCFRNGMPFLDCKFNYEHTSGLKFTDAARQHVHERAVDVDAAVRKIIASGKYATECACEIIQSNIKRIRFGLGASCRVDAAPACIEQMSRSEFRTGALVLEVQGYAFEGVPTKGATDYGGFDISPRLARGYAYRIGSPEGDDDTPYLALPPGRKIDVGTE